MASHIPACHHAYSKTVDFAPGDATRQIWQSISVVCDSGLFIQLRQNMT